ETRKLYHRPTARFPGGKWRKFLPTDLTSPWWYDAAALGKLIFAHIGLAERGGQDLTLRDFVRQFRGLSGSARAKEVCDQFPGVKRLRDLAGREADLLPLLSAMKAASAAPSPGVLGLVGEAPSRRCFGRWYGVRRWWYRRTSDTCNGVPFTVEVALAETKKPGRHFHGVNFSPTFDDPLAGTLLAGPEFRDFGLRGFLDRGH